MGIVLGQRWSNKKIYHSTCNNNNKRETKYMKQWFSRQWTSNNEDSDHKNLLPWEGYRTQYRER